MGTSVVDKNSPLSTPTKPSQKLPSSVEAKENRLTSPSFANQMKSSTKKNFMSPTISAASKTVAQRKKILAERNGGEATEPTCVKFHRRRSSSFDLKQGSVDMGASTDSLTSSMNEISSAEDGEDAAKLKPYDPVLNYCSPRPRFLLYKPDRRSEILRRYEMIDTTSSESETGSEHEECLVKQTVEVTEEAGEFAIRKEEVAAQLDEGAEESVEEINEKIEEHVEEVGRKSEDHNEVRENSEERIEVHEEILEDHVQETKIVKDPNMTNQPEIETISTKLEHETGETKSEALQTKKDDEIRIQSMETGDEDEEEGEFEEEGEVERCWSFKRLLKFWLVTFVLGLSTLYLSSMNSGLIGLNGEVHSGLYEVPFVHENASISGIQDELAKMGFEEASHRIKDEIIVREPDNDIGETIKSVDEEKNEGSHNDLGEVVEAKLMGVSTADQVEASEDEMDLASLENVSEVIYDVAGAENAGDIIGEELLVHVEESTTPEVSMQLDDTETENHDIVTEVVEPHDEASEAAYAEVDEFIDANHLHTEMSEDGTAVFEDSTGEELEVGNGLGVEYITETVGDGALNNLEKVEEVSEVSTPVMEDDGLLLRYTKETNKAAIVGVFSSLLLAFIGVLGFQKLKRTSKTLQEEAAGIPEQDAIRRQPHHVKQVEHFAYSSYSKPEVDGFRSGVGAPRVELLGEYTVGEKEVSSYSLRTDYMDNYNDSTYSFSQRNMKMSTSQPAVSGFSSTTGTPPHEGQSSQRRSLRKELPTSSIDSPSYGSFTTEMMFRKKEEARGGEKIIVTPVRRSSRIQSRMTPGASQ